MKVAWPYQTLRFAINNSHMPCVVIEPIFVCVMCLHELKTVQAKSRNEKALVWIKGSVAFHWGFPTRLSHDAFPQGFPTLTISSSAAPFSFCLQSFPASGSFPVSQPFVSGGQIQELQRQFFPNYTLISQLHFCWRSLCFSNWETLSQVTSLKFQLKCLIL